MTPRRLQGSSGSPHRLTSSGPANAAADRGVVYTRRRQHFAQQLLLPCRVACEEAHVARDIQGPQTAAR